MSSVVVRRGRKALSVHFQYDPVLVGKMHEVPGAEFDRRSKEWRIPVDEYALAVLTETLSGDLDLDPAVEEWARGAVARRESLVALRGAKDADLLYERSADLRPYQRAAVKFFASADGGLLADEMGLGKTVEALAAIREAELLAWERAMTGDAPDPEPLRCLVVCPNSMRHVWEREIARWYSPDAVVRHVRGELPPDPDPGFYVVNWELTHRRASLAEIRWDWMIADESHRMKGRQTKQSKAVRAFESDRRMCLTGTPIKNEVTDLWPQLQFLEPDRWTSYWKFFDRYVAWKEGFFGKEITGARNTEELGERLATVMLARKVEDVDLELPPLVRRRVTVDLNKTQRAAYDQMRDEFVAELQGADEDILAANWLSQVLRLKQIAGSMGIFSSTDRSSAKIDALLELMDEAHESEKWVVMSQFRTMIDEVAHRLREEKVPYCEMTGQSCLAWMPGTGGFHHAEDRAQLIDWFQRSDKPRAFIATTQTGGEGITLTAARRFAFLDLMWTPADNEQALKRIHRYGQDRTCFIYEVLARNTVDFSAILPTLRKKQDVIDAVMRPKEDNVGFADGRMEAEIDRALRAQDD